MTISSLYLDAFKSVAQYGSFTRAAQALHISQSALSQRVLNLESELSMSLFIRENRGLRITSAGESLLNYSIAKEKMESQVLQEILGEEQGSMSGEIKIASLSSLTRSIVFPCLQDIINQNENLHVEIYSKEISSLEPMAKSGAADIIVSYKPISRRGWCSEKIGIETNVLCTSNKYKNVPDKYLDHDDRDSTTKEFFSIQSRKPKNFVRDYYDNIYQIIDAVERGWGKAVIPKHLLLGNKNIKVIKGHKPLVFPVYLSYPNLPFYLKPLQLSLDAIKTGVKELLKG